MIDNPRPRTIIVSRCFIIRDGKLLAIQRATTDQHNPSLWEVPGGKLDEGQSLDHALEREAIEETGFLVRPIDTTAHFESKVLGKNSIYCGMPYVALFSLCTIVGGTLKLSNEHKAFKWCTYDELMELNLTPETRKASIVLENNLKKNIVA